MQTIFNVSQSWNCSLSQIRWVKEWVGDIARQESAKDEELNKIHLYTCTVFMTKENKHFKTTGKKISFLIALYFYLGMYISTMFQSRLFKEFFKRHLGAYSMSKTNIAKLRTFTIKWF